MKALIVEGGAMRGVFSAGILRAFADHKYNNFNIYIGVSAGACNLASFIAGNQDRNFGGYTKLMSQKTFFSWLRFFRGGHMMDLDWLWLKLNKMYPINEKKINVGDNRFYIVATNVYSGLPEYFLPTAINIHQILLASSGIPIVYRRFVQIENDFYTDGGISDPIPVNFAMEQGATDILVLRTRSKTHISKPNLLDGLWKFLLRRWPNLQLTFKNHYSLYNESLALIESPPSEIKITQICPTGNMKTSRTSQVVKDLEDDYEMGYRKGEEYLKSVSWNLK